MANLFLQQSEELSPTTALQYTVYFWPLLAAGSSRLPLSGRVTAVATAVALLAFYALNLVCMEPETHWVVAPALACLLGALLLLAHVHHLLLERLDRLLAADERRLQLRDLRLEVVRLLAQRLLCLFDRLRFLRLLC